MATEQSLECSVVTDQDSSSRVGVGSTNRSPIRHVMGNDKGWQYEGTSRDGVGSGDRTILAG